MAQTSYESGIITVSSLLDALRGMCGRMGFVVTGGLQALVNALRASTDTYEAEWKATSAIASADGGAWLQPWANREGVASASGKAEVKVLVPQSLASTDWMGGKAIDQCSDVKADARHWTLRLTAVDEGTKLYVAGGALLNTPDEGEEYLTLSAGTWAVCGEGGCVCVTKVSSNA